jgi:hypothetical protein
VELAELRGGEVAPPGVHQANDREGRDQDRGHQREEHVYRDVHEQAGRDQEQQPEQPRRTRNWDANTSIVKG